MQNLIVSRRSVRDFNFAPLEADLIDDFLQAGLAAPSARAKRPFEFVVVQDRSRLIELSEILEYGKMLKNASCAIFVGINTDLALSFEYGLIDTSAATQNILLSVHAHHLGAVWLGIYPREHRVKAMNEFFNAPPNITIAHGIAIGYYSQNPKEKNRFEKDKIHYERFS